MWGTGTDTLSLDFSAEAVGVGLDLNQGLGSNGLLFYGTVNVVSQGPIFPFYILNLLEFETYGPFVMVARQ